MSTLELAVFVGFFSGALGGCCIYAAFHWAHLRFQLALDYRLSDLEGRVTREVKIRNLEGVGKKKNLENELLAKIAEEKPAEELTLKTWREKAFKR